MTKRPLDGCRVLLVEDDPADAHMIATTLARAGATVSTAEDAERALPVAAALRFHVCVVDLVLPGMRGMELVATLKAGGYRGALVGLSAHLTPEVTELWLAAGCDVVLAKGEGGARLVETVVAICQSFERG